MTAPMYMEKKLWAKQLRGRSFSRQSAFCSRKQGKNVPGKWTGKKFLPTFFSRHIPHKGCTGFDSTLAEAVW